MRQSAEAEGNAGLKYVREGHIRKQMAQQLSREKGMAGQRFTIWQEKKGGIKKNLIVNLHFCYFKQNTSNLFSNNTRVTE